MLYVSRVDAVYPSLVEARGPGREESIIKRTSGGWVVISPRTHKRLGGPYKTKKEALRRLRQVEHFKKQKKQAREARRAKTSSREGNPLT